jgi:hypothetical protein
LLRYGPHYLHIIAQEVPAEPPERHFYPHIIKHEGYRAVLLIKEEIIYILTGSDKRHLPLESCGTRACWIGLRKASRGYVDGTVLHTYVAAVVWHLGESPEWILGSTLKVL